MYPLDLDIDADLDTQMRYNQDALNVSKIKIMFSCEMAKYSHTVLHTSKPAGSAM